MLLRNGVDARVNRAAGLRPGQIAVRVEQVVLPQFHTQSDEIGQPRPLSQPILWPPAIDGAEHLDQPAVDEPGEWDLLGGVAWISHSWALVCGWVSWVGVSLVLRVKVPSCIQ